MNHPANSNYEITQIELPNPSTNSMEYCPSPLWGGVRGGGNPFQVSLSFDLPGRDTFPGLRILAVLQHDALGSE